MVGHIFDLLYQKPEQEQALLSQLVNKLGDPVRRVASKTILLLLKLCEWLHCLTVVLARIVISKTGDCFAQELKPLLKHFKSQLT